MSTFSRALLPAVFACVHALAAGTAHACPVLRPDDEVLVGVALPGLGKADVLLQWYGDDEAGYCTAQLALPPERLPSLRLVPRLEDLATPVGVVARKLWSAERCDAAILVLPRSFEAYDPDGDLEVFGSIALEHGGWVARELDLADW